MRELQVSIGEDDETLYEIGGDFWDFGSRRERKAGGAMGLGKVVRCE